MDLLDFMLRNAMDRQQWSAALLHGRKLLELDPLMEHVHRAVMRCHFHIGDRSRAMRQYALCEQLLREELGVEPMEETRRIQQTILAVAPQSSSRQLTKAQVPRRLDLGRTSAQKVDMALSNINMARSWLEDLSHHLRRNPGGRA